MNVFITVIFPKGVNDRLPHCWQKCSFGDPLPRLFKQSQCVRKTWPLQGGACFPCMSMQKT